MERLAECRKQRGQTECAIGGNGFAGKNGTVAHHSARRMRPTQVDGEGGQTRQGAPFRTTMRRLNPVARIPA